MGNISQNNKNLLLVVPHLQAFIGDQVKIIKRDYNVTALMPVPYFYSVPMAIPIVRSRYSFMNFTIDSLRNPLLGVKLLQSKYFTLPLEVVRKKSFDIQANCSLKTAKKNCIHPSLIHAHFLEHGYIGARLKKKYRVPLIVTANGGDVYNLPFKNDWYYAFVKYVLSMSDEVITVSQFLVEKLLSIGLKPNKLHMIPNGFDNQLFKPTSREAARHKLGLPVNKRLLLSVGNLNNLKGHTYLIEAMRKVRHSIDDVLLIIIGSGPLEFELQKQIIASDLKKNVILVGNKRHEEIPLWMNACDLFVHPSLHESFGVVVIEALACGKPVLSTTVGGLPEIIRSGDLGLLVQSSNAQSLANGILDCLSKNWVEEKIINFSQQYTWRNLTSRIVGVYEKAIE